MVEVGRKRLIASADPYFNLLVSAQLPARRPLTACFESWSVASLALDELKQLSQKFWLEL